MTVKDVAAHFADGRLSAAKLSEVRCILSAEDDNGGLTDRFVL